ncbi:MAG TPA: helix-turn-helix domain-containing protein, partial [Methanocella sp.]|nr:helix-turn-helix domain-containing protein [Methanocella sp.]
MSDKWTMEALKRLGLTEYEAKAYMALNLIGAGTVSDIHLSSGVPRSAVYGALTKLEEKGLIDVEQSKPMRYRSVAPAKAIERLTGAIEADSEKARTYLEEAHTRAEGQAPAEAVWTVRGAMNLYNKLSEMIQGAHDNIIYIATDPMYFNYQELYPIFGNIMDMIQKKAGEGVRVRLVCTDQKTAADALKHL